MRPRTEERLLLLAARTSRGDAEAAAIRATVASGVDWDRLFALAHLHEVVPLVAGTLLAIVPDAVPPAWRTAATRRRHATIIVNGRLAGQLRRVLDAHMAAGIPAIPVKGLVLGETVYGDPTVRPSVDLDVLVRSSDLEASRAVLRELGFRQRSVHGFLALVHEFHEPAWAYGEGAEQVRLELHRALWDPNLYGLAIDELWERAVPGELLGGPALLLSREDMLLHLAIHRSRSALRLRWVCDVAELVRRDAATLDWAALENRAARAGARTAVWLVLDMSARLLGAPVPEDVLRRLRPGPVRRAILERTAGVTATLRPAKRGDVEQMPAIPLRALEQDGTAHMARSVTRTIGRRLRRIAHERGIRRVAQPVVAADGAASPARDGP